MANKHALNIALNAICSVALEKRSLSAFVYPKDGDMSEVKSLVFGTIRFYHQLNDLVSPLLKHPLKKEDLDIHCLLLLGAYQLLYAHTPAHAIIFETVEVANLIDKPWGKKLINAILRKIDRERDTLLSAHHSHPSWLAKKIKHTYPQYFEQIFAANNTQAPMTLRVGKHLNTQSYQQRLKAQDIDSHTVDIFPQGLVLKQAVSVDKLVNFDQGACYVQDLSAQLCATLLNPEDGELILDACAAPGGKATQLAEAAPTAKILALDSDENRLERIKENAKRLKINNINTATGDASIQDWWEGQLFDKILLDAPCSATGVIRRHPDIKLLRKPKDITQLSKLQARILDNLWPMLKPGGVLLYATCSILKAENEEQIQQFLSRYHDAKELPIELDWGIETSVGRQQLPGGDFDGFYYAKILKTA